MCGWGLGSGSRPGESARRAWGPRRLDSGPLVGHGAQRRRTRDSGIGHKGVSSGGSGRRLGASGFGLWRHAPSHPPMCPMS
eukprot:3225539-Pyramimonas_sp.AAC.1